MGLVATFICVVGIVALFHLSRDRTGRISRAVWIPALWLFMGGSRLVTDWFYNTTDKVSQYYSGDEIEGTIFQILLVCAVVVVASRKARTVAVLKKNWPILIFLAYCLVSVAWSEFPFVALKRWFKVAGDLSMVLILLTEDNPVAAVRSMLRRSGFFLLPVSVLLVLAYPDVGTTPPGFGEAPTVIGIAADKNQLGMTAMLWGLGFLWCLIDSLRRRREDEINQASPIAYFAVTAMAVWLVDISNSSTSLSCFYLGSALMVLTNLRFVNKRTALVHCAAIGVVSVALTAIFVAPSLLSTVGRDSSLTGRRSVWVLVEGMVRNPLLGTGFDSFWLGPRLYQVWRVYRGIIEAHNGYIEIYLNLGWIGLALFANMVLRGYGKVVRAVRERVVMSDLGLTCIAVAVIYNLSESGVREVFPVWIALVAAIAAARAVPSSTHPPAPVKGAGEYPQADGSQAWFAPVL